ncbi:hypothetical protein ACFX15_025642 [Malus domestica]
MEEESASPPHGRNLSRKVVAVAAVEAHTLALTGNGFVYSWGRGMFGGSGPVRNPASSSLSESSSMIFAVQNERGLNLWELQAVPTTVLLLLMMD